MNRQKIPLPELLKAIGYEDWLPQYKRLFVGSLVEQHFFTCPKGYGECENARECVYPGRCAPRKSGVTQ